MNQYAEWRELRREIRNGGFMYLAERERRCRI